ncbi:MAG: hypothetical protein KGL39_10485 [Patescibacteria group bacterium]|nr:hypothetical protein [Patescibacteria group bacterium]
MPPKLTIEEAHRIARERGGQCLSTVYINRRTPLLWQCADGHQWSAHLGSVKHQGTWCRKCSGNDKLTINDMREIARSHGGECLSTHYINAFTELKWRCAEGHEWMARPCSIKNGKRWCSVCAIAQKRLTIEHMQEFARSKGGKCLSTHYSNVKTKLLWSCSENHEWEAIPISILYCNHWCPVCAGYLKLTIDEMKAIAKERGGECLSDVYVNSYTKLLWKCSDGHK